MSSRTPTGREAETPRRQHGETRPRSCRGRSTNARATSRFLSVSCRACAPGWTASPRLRGRASCGVTVSSLAIGLIRRHRPRSPQMPKPPLKSWRRRISRDPHGLSPRRRRSSESGRLSSTTGVSLPPSASAFADAYVTRMGNVVSEAQTVYALALEWDLLPEQKQREHAGRRLADLVRMSGFRIATGFVGTPMICDALTHAGYAHVAQRLLLQTACPSWLYPVSMGATTVWERWDSMLPDGSINPGEMTSFNHYALGAVADWLHRELAGLAPAAPGYQRLRIAPVPLAALDHAESQAPQPLR